MLGAIVHTNLLPTTSEISRRAEHEACQRKLIAALRTVAFLAYRLANDTPEFSNRVRLAQITARCDAELRRLCNAK